MLSKVLRRAALESAPPSTWRPALSSPVEPPPDPVVAAVVPDDGPLLLVKARVAELELMVEKRAKESRDAGYREGLTAGKTQGSAEVKPVIEQLVQSIHQLSEYRPTLRLQAEADIVRLALAIARRVVNRELSTDPESILGLVKVALGKLRLPEVLRVRVHPNYLETVKGMLARLNGCEHIEIAGDPSIGLGGLLFEATRGEFDASVDTQLKEIERGLTDRLEG